MKGGKRSSQGFTIVETLIVLGVTSFMFVAAVVYISGRQNKAMFLDAMQDVRSQVLVAMNDANSGVALSTIDANCSRAGGGVRIQSGANNKSGDCILLGQAMTFGVGGNASTFRVDPVIGTRIQTNGQVSTSLATAGAIVANGQGGPADPIDLGASYQLRNGVELHSMTENGATTYNILGFAVVTSPDSQITYGADGLNSGSINANIISIRDNNATLGGTMAETYTQARARFSTALTNADFHPVNGIQLCFSSGTTDQSGLIVIGSNSRGLTAELSIKNGTTC